MSQEDFTRTVKWGIIGCGNVTERKSGPAYNKTTGFSLQAVMRRDPAKAADYAKRHNVPTYYSDADLLINDPEVNAVYIATPPDTHKYYALKVAAAGKPCCIEKPMAPAYEDCATICEAFAVKDIPLFVAYYRRSLPRFEQVKQWLADKVIGEVRHISWRLSRTPSPIDVSRVYNWRTDANIAPAGYFDDLASHGLDLFVYLLGTIVQASGVSLNQQHLYTAKDAVAATWLHESGVTGTGTWSFGLAERADVVEIFGSKGKIEFAVFDEVPLALNTPEGRTEIFIDHPETIQLFHVRNMREHLLGNSAHPSTGETGAHTAWVMDKILGKS